jgi:hypothetical protein
MSDYELGTQLRSLLLAEHLHGRPLLPRRLRAVVVDLCGSSNIQLQAPLNHLVQTPTFLQSQQQLPLPGDPQLALALQQILDDVFAPAINDRMRLVIRGLLGLPIQKVTEVSSYHQAAPSSEPAKLPLDVMHPSATNRGVVALMSFIAGILLVGVVFGISWVTRHAQKSMTERSAAQPDTSTPSISQSPTIQSRTQKPRPTPSLSMPALESSTVVKQANTLAISQAINSVKDLYSELSAADYASTSQRLSPAVADQFDPLFFAQFERVSVSSLVVVGVAGERVDLQGIVTFFYPDGTAQRETRAFTVDAASSPPLILESAFGRVVKPRR